VTFELVPDRRPDEIGTVRVEPFLNHEIDVTQVDIPQIDRDFFGVGGLRPEFADIVSLCQFLPGPNIIGIAVCTGTRLRGAAGALAAAAGFLIIPWGLGLAAGLLLLAHAQHPLLRNTLGGLSATAAGLLIATGIRLLLPHRRRPAALGFAVLALGLVIFGKLPLLIVLFGLVPISIVVAALQTARA